jgi:hypothetical protein
MGVNPADSLAEWLVLVQETENLILFRNHNRW